MIELSGTEHKVVVTIGRIGGMMELTEIAGIM